ncbi:hypothetical protein POM88_031141 [Heracleum sosnowskyi]|uniref:Uncharacterized protein n=1 Tax=Heracleum sosnowskyi TaxID=360622 RepID=A0AAD8HXQ8_9APIA|nr:hypothetical protein POM88_031141 [Heracleum sosnowskyi]
MGAFFVPTYLLSLRFSIVYFPLPSQSRQDVQGTSISIGIRTCQNDGRRKLRRIQNLESSKSKICRTSSTITTLCLVMLLQLEKGGSKRKKSGAELVGEKLDGLVAAASEDSTLNEAIILIDSMPQFCPATCTVNDSATHINMRKKFQKKPRKTRIIYWIGKLLAGEIRYAIFL